MDDAHNYGRDGHNSISNKESEGQKSSSGQAYVETADNVRHNRSKDIGQQRHYKKREKDQKDHVSVSRHTDHATNSAPGLKRWCQTLAAPMRLASCPSEASLSSVFSKGTNRHPWRIISRIPSRRRSELFIMLPPNTIMSGVKRFIRLTMPRAR